MKLNPFERGIELRKFAPDRTLSTEEAVEEYRKMLDENLEISKEIMDNLMQERIGIGYKQLERPGIEVKLK